jgi:hypothetical protein
MEIPHASLAQVKQGRDGRRVLIEDDVLDVARRLRELDPNLMVEWNEAGFFTISEMLPDGTQQLVTTTTDLNSAVPEYVAKLAKTDYVAEMDRMDAEAERKKEHRFAEQIGERGELLHHALRKDLSVQNRVYLPKGIDRAA